MIRPSVCAVVFCLLNICLSAQTFYGIGRNDELLDIFARLQLKYSKTRKPVDYNYIDGVTVRQMIESIDSIELSSKEKSDVDYLKKTYWPYYFNENSIESISNIFWTNDNFLSYQNDDVFFSINPAFIFSGGDDSRDDKLIFRNTRGIKIAGGIKNKVFFHTNIYESQARFLSHIERRISRKNAIPGQGFYKTYQSGLFDKVNGWDFLNAEALLTYQPSAFFRARLGHGNLFLGNGYSSLLLSDFSDNFFFIEFNTSIGIVNYKNIFAELSPIGSTIDRVGDNLSPKKYFAAHYLTIKPHTNFEFSIFESVIFGRLNHFEFQYLNPLILYRVVEQKLDSPDNVLIGLNFTFRVKQKTLFYGQLIVDELNISELINSAGWWGNKIGVQLGLKYPDFFSIEHLDLRVELNTVRPYTYSHRYRSMEDEFVVGAYSHYNQELAHPLGANFREGLIILKYKLNSRWSVHGKMNWAITGGDDLVELDDHNYGGDILKPNDTIEKEFGNKIGQGVRTSIFQISSEISYMPYHNYFIDFQFLYRKEESEVVYGNLSSLYFGIALRANMSNQKLNY